MSTWCPNRKFPPKNLERVSETVAQGLNILVNQTKISLARDVHLLFDIEEQSSLENWSEFQNHHLVRLKQLEKKWNDNIATGRRIWARD